LRLHTDIFDIFHQLPSENPLAPRSERIVMALQSTDAIQIWHPR
jgi:hypothetical protein